MLSVCNRNAQEILDTFRVFFVDIWEFSDSSMYQLFTQKRITYLNKQII